MLVSHLYRCTATSALILKFAYGAPSYGNWKSIKDSDSSFSPQRLVTVNWERDNYSKKFASHSLARRCHEFIQVCIRHMSTNRTYFPRQNGLNVPETCSDCGFTYHCLALSSVIFILILLTTQTTFSYIHIRWTVYLKQIICRNVFTKNELSQ